MASSPSLNADGVVTLSVLSNGKSIDSTISVLSVTVRKRINKIAYATLVLVDGDMPRQDFPLSNDDAFRPGAEIEIKAGYESDESTLFTGKVVRHGIRIESDNAARLVVECRDRAAAMTLGRKNANFVDMKDSDIITRLIGNCKGVTADVDATGDRHPELVQYYCTDWDFMLSRAEANGLLVLVDDGTVSVKAPDGSAAARLKLTYGVDIMEFEADVDARTQLESVTAASWDSSKQEVVSATATARSVTKQGNLKSADLASVLELDSFRLQTVARADESMLGAWARAQQQKAALAAIQGRVKFQGSALARIGEVLELAGVGERFDGDVFVAAVRHEVAEGNWLTEVEFGLPFPWFAERRDLPAPSAAGLLPGVDGLQIGVVKKIEEDPEAQVRVQVSVPVLDAATEGVWARLAKFYGSDGIGAFFIPEIGDEVVLGYLNSDPGQPVILGSLYSSKRKPPYALEDANNTKAIVTRSELRLLFDEEKKEITIITPAQNKIVLSDDGKSIVIEDETGNKGEFSPSGIALSSPRDITIDAKGKVAISAVQDVTVDGLSITATAKTALTVKGNATAELSAGGQATVKGAMVMIN